MLPVSLKIAPQGLLFFAPLMLLLGESPLSPKLVLKDCFCHSPALFLREPPPYPSKLPLRDCFPHPLPHLIAPQGITPFSLLLRDGPRRDVPSSSSGIVPSSPKLPLKDCSSCRPPPRCSSGKCSLILKTVPQVWPLIIFRDHSLMDHPFTPPQGSAPHFQNRPSGTDPHLLKGRPLCPTNCPSGTVPILFIPLQGSSPYSP